MFYEHIATK